MEREREREKGRVRVCGRGGMKKLKRERENGVDRERGK